MCTDWSMASALLHRGIMKIAIGGDHGAIALREDMVAHLKELGYEVKDFGTFSTASCDYPDFATYVGRSVAAGECDRGIVLCTTGIGVSITANKIAGVQCALLADVVSARLVRDNPDINVIAFGAAVVGKGHALEILDTWLGKTNL